MEVAGQWRREWAGTAEFGKVTEGGVTRQVARAMEVLHASAPGTRMRVMRAAYHSTAGPGIPASSFMLHSSRRVISSGFNLLESPTFPSKPLEISSAPLDSFPDTNVETENYKVTEPDDTEISEPTKWMPSTGSTLRMPSEESSSTDNASIIDLDNRSPHRNIFRKYSYDSESSDVLSSRKSSIRASPILETPVTLSTLKYKSLLNSSNDWNNRRKSYSFEDTCPANETIIHSNDILAMESSTDSGICKSTEIVNDQEDEKSYSNHIERQSKDRDAHDETFKDWLYKNRPSTIYKGTQSKPWRQHEVLIEDPAENNISLKSPGKVCITVPMTIDKEDNDKKVKKVEFCKTELHFAAESGKVNIIATDEKPPPSNDFRKRKSAFVPLTDKFEKPITLFGEKTELTDSTNRSELLIYGNSEITGDEIENTAATKSILKNKIPKPKPYLLGENTVFGNSDEIYEKENWSNDCTKTSGVLLINKQLESERKYSNEKVYTFKNEIGTGYNNNYIRTINKGPSKPENSTNAKSTLQDETTKVNSVKNKIYTLPMSPTAKPKTRQLRESDLMYFGIDNESKNSVKSNAKNMERTLTINDNVTDNIFQSVKLIKRISNSACNSEAESEDAPEYQNIVLNTSTSQPKPKPRSKYITATENHAQRILQPIVEQQNVGTKCVLESRRSRSKKYEEIVVPTPRSRSEPAKKQTTEESNNRGLDIKYTNRSSPAPRSNRNHDIEQKRRKPSPIKREIQRNSISEDEVPLYVNLKVKNKQYTKSLNIDLGQSELNQNTLSDDKVNSNRIIKRKESASVSNQRSPDKSKTNTIKKEDSLEKRHKSTSRSNKIQRTKKLVTPVQSLCNQPKSEDLNIINECNKTRDKMEAKQDHRSQSRHKKTKEQKHMELQQPVLIEDKEKTLSKQDKKHATKESNSKESGKSHKMYGRSLNEDFKTINSMEHRSHNDISSNRQRPSRRSEYVINYDDKNGTVSSICKIKPGHSHSKRKAVTKDKNKENEKETKHRSLDRTPLLQVPEQQWNRNGMTQEYRKRTVKNRVQRSCQLL